MIDDGTMKGTYIETADNTLKELWQFQDFLYRNFRNYDYYKGMQPDSNQPAPAHLYGTARTLKFKSLENIIVVNPKFPTIIDETETFTYNAAKVISDYLRFIYVHK